MNVDFRDYRNAKIEDHVRELRAILDPESNHVNEQTGDLLALIAHYSVGWISDGRVLRTVAHESNLRLGRREMVGVATPVERWTHVPQEECRMILSTKLYETEDDGRKIMRGLSFEINVPNEPFHWPAVIQITLWRDEHHEHCVSAYYERRDELMGGRQGRTYYVRVM